MVHLGPAHARYSLQFVLSRHVELCLGTQPLLSVILTQLDHPDWRSLTAGVSGKSRNVVRERYCDSGVITVVHYYSHQVILDTFAMISKPSFANRFPGYHVHKNVSILLLSIYIEQTIITTLVIQ